MSSIDELLTRLGDARKAVQRPAAEALAVEMQSRPDLRGRLASLLDAPAPRLRWGAAYTLALAERAPLDIVPVLLEVLGADDGDLRWASATIVTRIAALVPQVLDRVRKLATSSSTLQRKMALYCLRDAGARDGASCAIAFAALGDGDAAVRLAAMSAATLLAPGDAAIAERIATLIGDVDPGVSRAAAATLGRFGVESPAIRRALEEAATSADEALRRAAEAALSRLGAGARRPG